MSRASAASKPVMCGNGPEAMALRALAASTPVADRIVFFDDVDDAEKPALMAGAAGDALPSKPRTEFVETFGIALVQKLLAGGGPIITGGILEAVGPHAQIVPSHPGAISAALDASLGWTSAVRSARAAEARADAMQLNRINVFGRLFAPTASVAA